MCVLRSLVLLVLLFGSCQAGWNVTCDFDLDNIEEIVEYLSDECKEIYKSGAASELYIASVAESKKFKEFYEKLEAYEGRGTSEPAGEVLEQNTTLRMDIYSTVMLTECAEGIQNRTEGTDKEKTKEYYDCLMAEREQMINLIPK